MYDTRACIDTKFMNLVSLGKKTQSLLILRFDKIVCVSGISPTHIDWNNHCSPLLLGYEAWT